MKDWESRQNGTLGHIAGKGQVCRGWGGGGGFPLLPVKFAFTPTCLGRPPQSLQQTLQGPLSLLLCWVSPFSSSWEPPGFLLLLTQAQAFCGAASWLHCRTMCGVSLGESALWKDVFSAQDASLYPEQPLSCRQSQGWEGRGRCGPCPWVGGGLPVWRGHEAAWANGKNTGP